MSDQEFVDEQNEEVVAALRAIARAITPLSSAAGDDAAGGHVESLTEACMGITAGLVQVASALNNIAEAIRER